MEIETGLINGQNPQSSSLVTQTVLDALEKKSYGLISQSDPYLWRDPYGVQWEMEGGRKRGYLRGI